VLYAAAPVLLVTGCAPGPLAVQAPSPEPGEVAACEDFLAELPDELAGQDRREVTGGEGLVAAWGDPAIVLTCGVGEPAEFDRASTCVEANGTGWFVPDSVLLDPDQQLDVTMTAVDSRPRVEVFLPGDYRPDGFPAVTGTIGRLVSDQLQLEERCG
jgi:hypothetical protein